MMMLPVCLCMVLHRMTLRNCAAASARPSLREIAEVSGMAESTIQGVYSELAVHKRKFLPASALDKT